MENLSIGDLHFLFFIIPGFLVVWTFRYFTKPEKNGDFEFLGLSFVWGLVTLFLVEYYFLFFPDGSKKLNDLFKNPYSTTLVLSFFGTAFGWMGAMISRLIKFIKGRKPQP